MARRKELLAAGCIKDNLFSSEDHMEKWQLLKNGEIKKEYTDASKALLQYTMAKEIQPVEKWELRKVK